MGLLSDSDWSAKYVSYRDETPIFKDTQSHFLPAARYYRKEFSTGKNVTRATIYATALGIYELEVNGRRVGDAYFAPGWTDYRQRAYYNTYDVTDVVTEGANAIGAAVADGWYSGYVGFGLLVGVGTEKIGRYTYGKTPALRAQLEVEYDDGSRQVITTDKSWKVSGDGPIRQADLLMGEFYDARMEMPGWSSIGFDDESWRPAILAEENGPQVTTFYEFKNPTQPGRGPRIEGQEVDLGFKPPKLESFPGVPVRVTEEIRPIEISTPNSETYIFNLGQNFAGTIRLKVHGPAGHKLMLRFGEMLHPDGRLMTENLRRARATDYYVCKGDEDGEVYSPRFTFHGFQYVEVSNFPGEPDLDTIVGLALHSDTPLTSTFECSDSMVNQLFRNVVWTQRANFLDLPTDCPQRDERMGWTGDAQAYVATAAYNADIGAFYSKWLRELMESQRPSGAFPGYAPYPFQHGWDFGTAWADAGVICPWTIWQFYGDTRVIERCWEPMTRFMQWRKRTSQGELGISHGNVWGDWLAQGETTPLEYVDTIYFAISSSMMADMAEAIGLDKEAASYRQQFNRIKAAFGKKYLKDNGGISVKTQTAHALALFARLVPEDMRKDTGQRLAEMIALNGNHMATGFLGTRPLLPVLSSAGQHDLATFLLQSHEFPSWGYEIDQGATSIWERWDSYTKEDGFGRHNAAMNSFAHYAFGAVCEWMFRTLAGIESDGPGYSKIIIRPTPPAPGSNAQREPIDWVKASYDSIRGRITSDWKVEGDRFLVDVHIPANTTATVFVPAADPSQVTESGKPLSEVEHVRVLRSRNGRVVLSVASGSYRFESSGGIVPAKTSIKTSKPIDRSLNPASIDLTDAIQLQRWDFRQDEDANQWPLRNNLKFERRAGKTFLVATGADPQLAIELPKPLTGKLAIELKVRPAKKAMPQFFWASPSGKYNARQQNQREINPADNVNAYLFSLGDDQPLQKIRFDPFSNEDEMEIETLTIYRLAK
jgi:alpha-L-rhamnosidase